MFASSSTCPTFRQMTSSMAVLVVAGLASNAAADPGLEFRPLVTTGNIGSNPDIRYPGNIRELGFFDPTRILLRGTDGVVFMADGASLTRVMASGEQIPGLPEGAVWNSDFAVDIWPLEAGGSLFAASASGGGLVGSIDGVLFAGELTAPINLGWDSLRGCTRNGLRLRRSQDGLEVGPLAGPFTSILPNSYAPPGTAGTFVNDPYPPALNRRGEITFSGILIEAGRPRRTISIVKDVSNARIVYDSGIPFATDRGPVTITNSFIAISHATPSGAVVFMDLPGFPSSGLWLIPMSGAARTIARAGDPAPGLPSGITFTGAQLLAVNRHDSVLFDATLTGPGVDPDNEHAVYLWRSGDFRLIARTQRTVSSGVSSPPRVDVASLDDQDRIGLMFSNAVHLFHPATGTIDVAVVNAPAAPIAGARGTITGVTYFSGSSSQTRLSGGDDTRISHLSPDGWFGFGILTEYGTMHGSVRIALCPADFNEDGFTDFFDYSDFVECFEGGRCPDGKTPDFNRDDFDDFFDYADFVATFESGC